ncbi:MAG: RelA/SpoT family protein [bacterium]|nr:RelA/SpoT family protein [bacterium]MDZ4247788.1 RelA/SpoT family protein [Patescibacteria group bacterium]
MSGDSTISAAHKRLRRRLSRFSDEQRDLIERAFRRARASHDGQYRRTGEPYVCHCLEVAILLCDWRLDAPTVAAALLHDVPEDTDVTIEQIADEFGGDIAGLVEAVTKLSSVRMPNTEIPVETENLRRLFLAMAKDVRVVLLKLADRLHNVRTIVGIRSEKRKRFALETIEIFAPLADGLGMGEVRAELSDRGFEYAYPRAYRELRDSVQAAIKEGERYLSRVKRRFGAVLAEEGIAAHIDARTKTLYSLYRKLQEKRRDIDKIYDLFAVRVIVDSVPDCYRSMGVIHRTWQPLPHRIKDYIAVPKSNGYRSLHTTVFGPQNRLLEVQFRTWQMHDEAEHGVSAHYVYDKGKQPKRATEDQSAMMRRLRSWQDEVAESTELVQRFKLDLFTNRIFVFTPHGQVHSLPAGSSPVDFAYSVHTDVGHSCRGANVNGVIVPLDSALVNGDVVEIIRGDAKPNRNWLKSVRTGHARWAIRRYFREHDRDAMVAAGRKELAAILKRHRTAAAPTKAEWRRLIDLLPGAADEAGVMAAIGERRLSETALVRALGLAEKVTPIRRPRRPARVGKVIVDNQQGLPSRLARCCKPRPPGSIVGYVTLQKSVSIHRESCPQVRRSDNPARLVAAHWAS